MKTFLRTFLFFMLAISLAGCSSKTKDENSVKNWAWLAGDSDMPADQLDNYFKNAKDCGIDAILLQVHGGYPKGMADTSDFTDYDAIKILENAVPVAKKYGIELHAWMWTINRCEKNLRAAHPDWYMVNANDTSCLDIKLYNREHYRWLCPSRPETLEYLKERVAELAKIDGVAGVHLDFIRYPDAILPYGLHESRGVVQDKVYPHWDHCYCEHCRAEFEKLTGIDPMELEDPTSDQEWMKFRWDAVVNIANELAREIKKYGKVSSAAVFASPSESRKLVRQDWSRFTELDILFPMIYHKFYDKPDPWVYDATKEGVCEMDSLGCKGYLVSGLFVGHVPVEKMHEIFTYAKEGGSKGIALFSLEGVEKTEGYWEALKKEFKGQ